MSSANSKPSLMDNPALNAGGLYVQFGAGHCGSSGWLNFDSSPTLRLERLPLLGAFVHKNPRRFPNTVRYGDIVRGLPLPPTSCRGLYGSHVLEHLALTELRKALANCYALARAECIIRLVVPDLEAMVHAYITNPAENAAVQFVRATALGSEQRSCGIWQVLRNYFSGSRHLWMWDFKSLAAELRHVGFRQIRRCQFGDSSDPMFQIVETSDRFDDALAIEARK